MIQQGQAEQKGELADRNAAVSEMKNEKQGVEGERMKGRRLRDQGLARQLPNF
jgi:hypothetical protein